MKLDEKNYRELAAIPSNRPYVSHINYTDNHGRQITLFPAFRSSDDLDQISRIQSPIKANTVPLIAKNHEKYEKNYRELVREFGPPKNDSNSLFLFGKDEIYRSESIGNSSLKPSLSVNVSTNGTNSCLAPVNPDPPPPPPPPSSPPPPPPFPPPFPPINRSELTQKTIRSQTFPRMRYIYAFPEEFQEWISQIPQKSVEVSKTQTMPPPRRGISFEDRPKTVIEELKAKLGRQHSFSTTKSSMNSSIQRRVSESFKNRKMIENNPLLEQKPISKNFQPSSQTSPNTFVSTSATSSNFSFRKGKQSIPNQNETLKRESQPSETNAEIFHFLKETPAHVRPHIQNFIFSHFENPQKQLDHTEWSETEIPMKHYWQKVFKVKDDKKSATIKIENLLSIEPEIGPFHGFVPNKSFSNLSQMNSSRRISDDSGTLSVESGFNSNSRHVMSAESSPVSSTSEMDFLTVVLKKIRQKKALDWPELFLLKNDHCRFVLNREKELKKYRKLNPIPSEAKLLERDIIDNYRGYQQALEQAVIVDELYTKLAYKILHAESYWYAAKITSDQTLKHHFYALARQNYSNLLDEAKFNLEADDKSLLTILEKMTQILTESNSVDFEIVAKCRRVVFEAEKALESKPDVKKERKVIKIKNNLLAFK